MLVRNSRFAAYLDVFTSNTCCMVILTDPEVRVRSQCNNSMGASLRLHGHPHRNPEVGEAAIRLNIEAARTHFDRFIPRNSG